MKSVSTELSRGVLHAADLRERLPVDAGCADCERIVVITRETLVRARRDIPEA